MYGVRPRMNELRTTPMPLNPETLVAMKEVAARATPGPWRKGLIGGQCVLSHFPHGQGKCDYRTIFNDNPSSISRIVNEGGKWNDSTSEDVLVVGQYDYEEGGVVHERDPNFIATCNPQA